MAIQWSVLYDIFKTNIEPANLSNHTILYHTILFIWYRKAILLMYGAGLWILYTNNTSSMCVPTGHTCSMLAQWGNLIFVN